MRKRPIWNIGVIQTDIRIGEPEHNQTMIRQKFCKAMQADPRPDLMLFPEMWNTGYAWGKMDKLADKDGDETKQMLMELASMYQVHIVGGSVAVRSDDQLWNVCYVLNRYGDIVHEYRKAHLFQLMDEHRYLEAGETPGIFELDGVRCGVIICYDLRFPEWSRRYALEGVEILFVPAQWPHPRAMHWQTLLAARAIENQFAVAACNRVGTSIDDGGESTTFCGCSSVLNAWGEAVAQAEGDDCILHGKVDLEHVKQVRASIPIFEDRRERIYRKTTRQEH